MKAAQSQRLVKKREIGDVYIWIVLAEAQKVDERMWSFKTFTATEISYLL